MLCGSPPAEIAVRLWAEVARSLLDGHATVSVDVDDGETEMRLRVAGFRLAEVDADEQTPEIEESLTLERSGPLAELLEPVIRLPPDAPLGALAVAEGKGVDLDLGAGLDVWGAGALAALRTAAARLNIMLRENAAEEE